MLCGFVRFRSRRERRPGVPVEPLLRHLRRRAAERIRWARGVAALYFELQEVWLATRGRARFQAGVDAWASRWNTLVRRVNLLAIRSNTRSNLDAYWRRTWTALRRGRVYRINPVALMWNLMRDAKLCLGFNLSLLGGYRR
jgi:hypothetical protein